jgi:hypothetical protein
MQAMQPMQRSRSTANSTVPPGEAELGVVAMVMQHSPRLESTSRASLGLGLGLGAGIYA